MVESTREDNIRRERRCDWRDSIHISGVGNWTCNGCSPTLLKSVNSLSVSLVSLLMFVF